MHKLVLLRHGESQWNLENRFTGWTNVELSKNGVQEAKKAGYLLKNEKIKFKTVYTSLLKRSKDTMRICLKELSQENLSIKSDWRLNERHYGELQGLNKSETAKIYGDKQVLKWRRSYDLPPPPLNHNDERHPRFDKLYDKLDFSQLPSSESLKDTKTRFMSLWNNEISKNINLGGATLIVAHGNSLRALIKYLDNISDVEIVKLNIPTGIPLIYELDNNLKPLKHYYLGLQKSIDVK